MSKIRAIIFDIDGTLIDTSEYIYQAYEHVIAKHGYSRRSRQDIASQIGKKIEECYAFLTPGSELEAMLRDHDAFQVKNLALIRPFASVNETLAGLKERGLSLALWTGRRTYVVESLQAAGIDTNNFDMVLDAKGTLRGKPDPEGIYHILGTLHIQPDEAIIVGDAAVDILAGKNAALAGTVGITHGFGTREEILSAAPDSIIDSLHELPAAIESIHGVKN